MLVELRFWWHLRRLRSGDLQTRKVAVQGLGNLGDERAVEPLLEALTDYRFDYLRLEVVEALGKLRDRRVVEALIERLLLDEEGLVQIAAAEALGNLRDGRACEELATSLKHGQRLLRVAAADALGKIGGRQAIESLTEALDDDSDSVERAVKQALEALGVDTRQAALNRGKIGGVDSFEVEKPSLGIAVCSDPDCACGDVTLGMGSGYLWISPEVVEFRKKCPRIADLKKQIEGRMVAFGPGVATPIAMCEQAARRRELDLATASMDFDNWWKTGRVPLRPTPKTKR